MKLKDIPKDELELMGYDDIAYIVLQENGKKMKLLDIFKKVCEALELPEGTAEEQLMDFFEQMSINKKFTMLKNGFWDLQSRHKSSMIVEDGEEDEEFTEIEEDIDEEEPTEENEDIFYDGDETDDEADDDLADLMVVSEDEEQ